MKIIRKIPSAGNQPVPVLMGDGTEYIFRPSEDRDGAPLVADVQNMEHVGTLLAAANVFMLDEAEALPVEPSKEAELQALLDESAEVIAQKNAEIAALQAKLDDLGSKLDDLTAQLDAATSPKGGKK